MEVLFRIARIGFRVVGVVLAAWALLGALCVTSFRLDSAADVKMVEQVDFELGGIFAVAALLFFAPDCRWNAKRWLLAIISAILIWACVSGSLIGDHRHQLQMRTSAVFED